VSNLVACNRVEIQQTTGISHRMHHPCFAGEVMYLLKRQVPKEEDR